MQSINASKKIKYSSVGSCKLRSEEKDGGSSGDDDQFALLVEALSSHENDSFESPMTAPFINIDEDPELFLSKSDIDDFLACDEATSAMMHVYIQYVF